MAINMKQMTKQLELHEGIRLKPYYCTSGKLTIGIGRNLEDNGVSKAEATFMLQNDLVRIIEELDDSIPWWRDLSEVRRRVLIDMAFNLGTFGLTKFKNMLAAARDSEFEKAAEEMLDSRWAEQVGQRANRLANAMRQDEIDLS
jgi:lysozyme